MTSHSNSAQPLPGAAASRPVLRRELRFLETASVSIGVMAPTLAMSVTGVAAAAAVWLCSPQASYITGSVLVADGGWLAG